MITWILILAAYQGGITNVEFPTRQGCEAALAAAMNEFQLVNVLGNKTGRSYTQGVCVEKK